MKVNKSFFILVLKQICCVFIFNFISPAQAIPIPQIDYSPLKYICYKSAEPIAIDGELNESSWTKAEWTDDFVDIEGSLKPVPKFRTRAAHVH